MSGCYFGLPIFFFSHLYLTYICFQICLNHFNGELYPTLFYVCKNVRTNTKIILKTLRRLLFFVFFLKKSEIPPLLQ